MAEEHNSSQTSEQSENNNFEEKFYRKNLGYNLEKEFNQNKYQPFIDFELNQINNHYFVSQIPNRLNLSTTGIGINIVKCLTLIYFVLNFASYDNNNSILFTNFVELFIELRLYTNYITL